VSHPALLTHPIYPSLIVYHSLPPRLSLADRLSLSNHPVSFNIDLDAVRMLHATPTPLSSNTTTLFVLTWPAYSPAPFPLIVYHSPIMALQRLTPFRTLQQLLITQYCTLVAPPAGESMKTTVCGTVAETVLTRPVYPSLIVYHSLQSLPYRPTSTSAPLEHRHGSRSLSSGGESLVID